MKLMFFWVAPPRSRRVSPLVSRIWVKNSSSPRLGRGGGSEEDKAELQALRPPISTLCPSTTLFRSMFFWVAPPRSRRVSPLVSRIWVKNSSSPRLGREERVGSMAPPRAFMAVLPPPEDTGGPPPACPPRDPRKNPFSGSSMKKSLQRS